MRSIAKLAARAALLAVAVGLIAAVLNGAVPAASPYVSALSAITDVNAQFDCNNKGCVSGGHGHSNCGKLVGFYCYKFQGSSCSTGQC